MAQVFSRALTAAVVAAAAVAAVNSAKAAPSSAASGSAASGSTSYLASVMPLPATPATPHSAGLTGAVRTSVAIVCSIAVGAALAAGAVLLCRHLEAGTPPNPMPQQYTVTDVTPFIGESTGRPTRLRITMDKPATAPASQRTHEYLTVNADERWEVGQQVPLWRHSSGLMEHAAPVRPRDVEPFAFALALVLGTGGTFGSFTLAADLAESRARRRQS